MQILNSVTGDTVLQAIKVGEKAQPAQNNGYALENYNKRLSYNWYDCELELDELRRILIGGGHDPWAFAGQQLGELIPALNNFLEMNSMFIRRCESCKQLEEYICHYKKNKSRLGCIVLYKEQQSELTYGYCDGMHRMMAMLIAEYSYQIPAYIGFDPNLDGIQSSSW